MTRVSGWLLCLLASMACSPVHPEVDAGSATPDGTYACHGTQGSGSCDEPIGSGRWTVDLDGGLATLRFEGASLPALSPEISCAGRWTDDRLDCGSIRWVRQGRDCRAEAHFRVVSSTALTFWTGSADQTQVIDQAACSR